MVAVEKFQFIIKQNEKNRLSHAFLIETNSIEECLKDVKEVIKMINKDEKNDNLDKLIDLDNLPSLVIIKPDGFYIKKNQLEELEQKFSTMPIYSKYNNYVILNADKMNDSASNTILKFLEEPENNIIGFLIVNNKENVLATIRSRCEIVHVDYNKKTEYDEELIKIANKYINDIEKSESNLINKKILENNLERCQIEELLKIMFDNYYNRYMNSFEDKKINKKYQKIIEIIQKELNLIQYNVNLELILDGLV